MLKSRNNLFVIFLATLVFFLMPTVSLAAGDNANTPFIVEDIGIMSIGGKWKAVSAEEVLTAFEKIFEKMIADNPAVKKPIVDSAQAVDSANQAIDSTAQAVDSATQAAVVSEPKETKQPYDFAKLTNMMLQQLAANNIKIYQLAIDSNNTYYTSYLIFYKEKNPINPNNLIYFDKNAKKEDRQKFADQMREFQDFIIQMTKSISQRHLPYFNAEALPAAPPETLTVKDLPAYGFESRIAFNFAGLTSPTYGKTYVFNLDGYQTFAILYSVDSERHFWNKTFKSMITSLK